MEAQPQEKQQEKAKSTPGEKAERLISFLVGTLTGVGVGMLIMTMIQQEVTNQVESEYSSRAFMLRQEANWLKTILELYKSLPEENRTDLRGLDGKGGFMPITPDTTAPWPNYYHEEILPN